jgi:AcrR family transcriptional regulator
MASRSHARLTTTARSGAGPGIGEDQATRPRARAIVAAASQILEEEGREALTMRRLAAAVGIRAPSLYKHFPDKAAVEVALIERGFTEWTASFEEALTRHGESLTALTEAYRAFSRQHPHLYRLMTNGPLPRDRLRPGVEAAAAAPLLRVAGDADLARAVWAFAHGMTMLELDGRVPRSADLDAAWASGIAAFAATRDAD